MCMLASVCECVCVCGGGGREGYVGVFAGVYAFMWISCYLVVVLNFIRTLNILV